MVKFAGAASIKLVFLALTALAVFAQTDAERERRLADLERKMRQLDPTFSPMSGGSIDVRLSDVERKIDGLLAASRPNTPLPAASNSSEASTQPTPPTPVFDQSPLQQVSINGDYQKSGEGETRLPVAGYMDAHFNKNAGEPGRADFHRFVLLFGHSFSERIKFWSELELEHALIEGGEERGEVALEQAYLDFLVKPWLNFRGGMVLSPVGIINERHEPPAFNGVERPFVETVIIPTTWREIGAGLTGDLGRGFRYRSYLISALDPTGFNAEEGIRNGRSEGFNAPFRNPATVGRLEFAGIRRLTLGLSGYTGVSSSPAIKIMPRVSIFSFDVRHSIRRLDFRGLFASTWITKTRELNAALEQLSGFSPNVGKQLLGYYIEPGLHVFPRRLRSDMIVFARYEKYNTQHRMATGLQPLPEFDRSSVVTGVTFKPNADIAIKFDYVFNRNAASIIRPVNGINLGLGWWF
jgi:hypothetical protein